MNPCFASESRAIFEGVQVVAKAGGESLILTRRETSSFIENSTEADIVLEFNS